MISNVKYGKYDMYLRQMIQNQNNFTTVIKRNSLLYKETGKHTVLHNYVQSKI